MKMATAANDLKSFLQEEICNCWNLDINPIHLYLGWCKTFSLLFIVLVLGWLAI